jgi:hypothetical protein
MNQTFMTTIKSKRMKKMTKVNPNQLDASNYSITVVCKDGTDKSPADTLLMETAGKVDIDFTKDELHDAIGVPSRYDLASKMANMSGEFLVTDMSHKQLAALIQSRLSKEELLFVVTAHMISIIDKTWDGMVKMN